MAFKFFTLLTTSLKQAVATNMHKYCCNNAVTLLNIVKS